MLIPSAGNNRPLAYLSRLTKASGQYVTRQFTIPSLKGHFGSSIAKSEFPDVNSTTACRGLLVPQSDSVRGPPATCSMMPSHATMYDPTLTSGA